MLASKNTRPNLTTKAQVIHWLRVLASELSVRLLEARDLEPTIWPKTLVLHLRQGAVRSFSANEALTHSAGYGSTRSKQLPFPFSNVISPDIILKPAEKLFAELSGTASFRIDNISLAFAGLSKLEPGQKGIEIFLGTPKAALERSPDEPLVLKRKRSQEPGVETQILTSSDKYACPRCRKVLSLPRNYGGTEMAIALHKLQMEHDDFHVAQDLAREVVDDDRQDNAPSSSTQKRHTVVKRKPPTTGITSFFKKK
jgi:DNA polymerase eta